VASEHIVRRWQAELSTTRLDFLFHPLRLGVSLEASKYEQPIPSFLRVLYVVIPSRPETNELARMAPSAG
jgi:hypothetical protein